MGSVDGQRDTTRQIRRTGIPSFQQAKHLHSQEKPGKKVYPGIECDCIHAFSDVLPAHRLLYAACYPGQQYRLDWMALGSQYTRPSDPSTPTIGTPKGQKRGSSSAAAQAASAGANGGTGGVR